MIAERPLPHPELTFHDLERQSAESKDRGLKITGGRLRPASYRISGLQNVALTNTDLTGVALLKKRLGGRPTIDRCDFLDVRWNGMRLRDVVITRSTFQGLSASDIHLTGCDLVETAFEGVRLKTAVFEDCRFQGVRLVGRFGGRMFFDRCELVDTVIAGEASQLLSPRSTTLSDVDLSGLVMHDSELSGQLRRVVFPVRPDCFVVPRTALRDVVSDFATVAHPDSVMTYKAYIEVASGEYFVVDHDVLDLHGLGPGRAPDEAEIQHLMSFLYEYRVPLTPDLHTAA